MVAMIEKDIEYDIKDRTDSDYLVDRIVNVLEDVDLIEKPRHGVYFKAAGTGSRMYRGLKRGLSKGVGGRLFSYIGNGLDLLGEVSGIGAISGLDKKLDGSDLGDVAKAAYRTNRADWWDAYDALDINKGNLDGLVYMAQVPEVVMDGEHDDDKIAAGIASSRVADFLYEKSNVGQCEKLGIGLGRIIGMLGRQKMPNKEDTKLLREFDRMYDIAHIVDFYNGGTGSLLNGDLKRGFELLSEVVDNYEFTLGVGSSTGVNFIGTQLSRGCVKCNGAAGDNTAIYMGKHAVGKDFPRMFVKNVGSSFMANSYRGLGRAIGLAGHEVMGDSTGGIAVVNGLCDHRFARGMTDSTWPAIAVSISGSQDEIHGVEDGLVILQNTNLGIIQPSVAYRVRDGEFVAKYNLKGNAMVGAAHVAEEYIREWAREHPGLIQDWTREHSERIANTA